MKQEYDKYTLADFKVWKTLYERQEENLQDKCCKEYLDCLASLDKELVASSIPRFEVLSDAIKKVNGWSIEVVPGLIEVDHFFELLEQKRFCSSTWLRPENQLDYLEEPDMFHDIFGHIPLFLNKEFGDFAQKMGSIAMKHKDDEQVMVELQRLYWFTIEFGVMKENGETKIYGAGIISSLGESNYVFEKEGQQKIIPFDLEEVIKTEFDVSRIQDCYFEIDSYEQLYTALMEYESRLAENLIL